MYERFLVTSGDLYGHFGSGATLEEAKSAWWKAGGRKRDPNYRVQKFVSTRPFAPVTREATEEEADCWIGRDGATNWLRCERVVE